MVLNFTTLLISLFLLLFFSIEKERLSCCLATPDDNENRYPPHPDPLPPRGEGKK